MTSAKSECLLVACTLFEGHYHHGVATWINSLVLAGYQGEFWIGYRGILPAWMQGGSRTAENVSRLVLPPGTVLNLVRLDTDWHFTNYKPKFLESLLDGTITSVDGACYFDPDVTIRGSWELFRQWVRHGIALCEDVNSPLHPKHPMRLEWSRAFPQLTFREESAYVNGGFVGLLKEHRAFLGVWHSIIEQAAPFTGGPQRVTAMDPGQMFWRHDQDALNIALSTTRLPVSIVGPEGMDFKFGGYLMTHAIGPYKPWATSAVRRALAGARPGRVYGEHVKYLRGPARSLRPYQRALRRVDLLAAKVLGRSIT